MKRLDYVLDQARYVIESFGPRAPGSEGETRLQEYVRDRLTDYTQNKAEIESFAVAQKAFMSVPVVTAGLLLLSFPAYWISPILATVFSGLGMVVGVLELLLYKRFLDPLFPKRTSNNVLARQKPEGVVTRRIVLNAHPDGAYEWRWNYLFPRKLGLFLLYGLLALPAKFDLDTLGVVLVLFMEEPNIYLSYIGWVQLLLLPACIQGLGFTNYRVVSPGANDNLTGVFILLGIAKSLHENGLKLENTEIVYLNTGSEEAGLRGAKHFVESHAAEYKDVETLFIALDTFRDSEHLAIVTRDMNKTVAHDAAIVELVRRAGRECGYDLPCTGIPVGSTDGAAFTQGGLRAVALIAINQDYAPFYHNRRDNWDNMSEDCVRKTIEVIGKTLEIYDAEGIGKRDD